MRRLFDDRDGPTPEGREVNERIYNSLSPIFDAAGQEGVSIRDVEALAIQVVLTLAAEGRLRATIRNSQANRLSTKET